MATSRDLVNPALSRYNARRKQLHSSMLEYTERFREICLPNEDASPRNEVPLEIHARRKLMVRNSDPDLLVSKSLSPTNRTRKRRPHSLDENDLVWNRQVRKNGTTVRPRNIKSEYGAPSLSLKPYKTSTSGPPNSPNNDRTSNSRVSFVCASDLYDLVGFGQGFKGHTNRPAVRDSDGGDEFKDKFSPRRSRERKNAWSSRNSEKETSATKQPKQSQSSSDAGSNVIMVDELLIGKQITQESKPKFKEKSPDRKSKTTNTACKDEVSVTNAKTILPAIQQTSSSQSKDEVYPISMILESALNNWSKTSPNKLSHRPKRAKRMQLHKSKLVTIPETYSGGLSRATFFGAKNGNSSKHEDVDEASGDTDITTDANHNFENISPERGNTNRASRKKQRQQQHRQRVCQTLDTIIEKNNIYPTLPWEHDFDNQSDDDTATSTNLQSFNNNAVLKTRKVKRLVFLSDQPEDTYRR